MEKKISFFSSLTFGLLILFACFYIIKGAKLPERNKWLAVCPTVEFLQNSIYTAECSGIDKPLDFTKVIQDDKLKVNSSNALCMMVYDASSKLCSYSSRVPVNKESNIKLPKTSNDFDAELNKLEPKPNNFTEFINTVHTVCKNSNKFNNIDTLGIQSDPELVNWIKYVNEKLLSDSLCPFTCHIPETQVNRLCMVLFWANELFSKMTPVNTMQNKNVNLPSKQESAPVKNPAAQESDKIKQEEKKVHNTVEESNTKINKLSENIETPQQQPQPPASNSQVDVANKNNNDDIKSKAGIEIAHTESETKKAAETHKLEEPPKQDTANLPLSSKTEKSKPVISQSQDTNGENSIVMQPDDGSIDKNPDEFMSGEEHPKPVIQVEGEDGNEHDNIDNNINNNNAKESNLDDGFAMDNLGNPRERIQSANNLFPHSVKEEDESHFFTYFSVITLLFIVLYIGYHNKQKILAIVLEGRRSRRSRGSRRRPSTASYRKLDCNLEEAVTSQCNSNVTHVIY